MGQTIISIMPITVLVVVLAVLRRPAWMAALCGLLFGAVEAFFAGVPCGAIYRAAVSGVSTGLYPISLVIAAALFTYALTVESGAVEEIKRGLSSLSPDRRFQALLIAWGFGNFMEGMAGFGTAVAIPCAILVGIGFDPVKAVLCCLVANTTPTAFGSVGVPTMVLATETGLPLGRLTTTIAFLQLAATALSPFLVLWIADGRRGLAECWKLGLVAAVVFLAAWIAIAPTLGCELPNIIGGMAVMVVFAFMGKRDAIDARRQLWAWMPFAFVVVALGLAAFLPPEKKISPGFVILAAAIPGGLCQGVAAKKMPVIAYATLRRYALALFTICAVLALAKIMGVAGFTADIAKALVSATGEAYAAVSSIVGAFAGFVTGSGTSSNVLFGALQSSVGTNEAQSCLFAAANVMGAGIGKMICPQSIVLGCAAAGLAGRESDVMAKAFRYFIIVIAVATIATVLAAAKQ